MTEHSKFALIGAVLNCVLWTGWMGLTWRLHTIEVVGPFLFWTTPIGVSALIWVALVALGRPGLSLRHRLGAALAGILATAVGCPLAIATGLLMTLGAYFPLIFVSFVLEALLLWLGFTVIWALSRTAIALLDPAQRRRQASA